MHPVMHEVIKLCKSMETQAALFISEMVSHCALILCSINVARKAFLESTLCLCNLICNPLIPTDSTSLAPGQVVRRAEATVTPIFLVFPTHHCGDSNHHDNTKTYYHAGPSAGWAQCEQPEKKRHQDNCFKRNTVQINSAIIRESELN